MNINVQIRYYTRQYSWLCFNHAVKLAMQETPVETEIGDFETEYYGGPTYCVLCKQEDELLKKTTGRE